MRIGRRQFEVASLGHVESSANPRAALEALGVDNEDFTELTHLLLGVRKELISKKGGLPRKAVFIAGVLDGALIAFKAMRAMSQLVCFECGTWFDPPGGMTMEEWLAHEVKMLDRAANELPHVQRERMRPVPVCQACEARMQISADAPNN